MKTGVQVRAVSTAEKQAMESSGGVPADHTFVKSKTADQWDLVPNEKLKEVAAAAMNTSEDTGPIEVGDRVFVRALKTFGTVIRVNGGVTFVETEKEKVRPCWELELEKR